MDITYLANVRMPTEKAHGAQIAHTCAAFARLGSAVELWDTDAGAEQYRFVLAGSADVRRMGAAQLRNDRKCGNLLDTWSARVLVRFFDVQELCDHGEVPGAVPV